MASQAKRAAERIQPWIHQPKNSFHPSKKVIPVETIFNHDQLFHDLLLCGGNGVTYERALARRREIDSIYQSLHSAEIVIITLGFIEAWYDQASCSWLNRMPPFQKHGDPDRFIIQEIRCL